MKSSKAIDNSTGKINRRLICIFPGSNFGLGVGVTRSIDHLIAKMILGYRFNF